MRVSRDRSPKISEWRTSSKKSLLDTVPKASDIALTAWLVMAFGTAGLAAIRVRVFLKRWWLNIRSFVV